MTETEVFLTSIRNCRHVDLYVDAPALSPEEIYLLSDMKTRRKKGEPFQYILGHADFLGLKILVDARVLIPRPETELLVEAVIKLAQANCCRPAAILDVGTGSGNIAIALAKNIVDSRVTALDISQDALDLAKQNAKINSVEERISFFKSDIFDSVTANRKFDIIVSNPPYIRSADLDGLPADVQKEPRLALDGGVDGLQVYRRLISASTSFLKSKGFLVMECADEQGEAIKDLLMACGDFKNIEVHKDLNQKDRIIIAERI